MTKTAKSINLDDEIWDEIDVQKGDYGTISGFLNVWLKEKLIKK